MGSDDKKLSRRRFVKSAGVAGLGATLFPFGSRGQATAEKTLLGVKEERVLKRPFGKTGVDVAMLSLGGVLKPSDQLIFRIAFNMGVTYWDTADSYGWGKNEKAIGDYFAKYPQDRDEVFLVTKAKTSDPKELTAKLNSSLERMNTTCIDLYFIHYVKDVAAELTKEVKAWADKNKSAGKIRLFGFSTHKNMEATMLAAAKLGWIDGIMMSYNYRLMGTKKMKAAVDACVSAGIGLTAMKTQAAFSANFYASIGSKTDAALKLTENFIKKGFTAEQAKLKAVWENPHIASICSAMPNMTILKANVEAALNKTELSMGDKTRLKTFAQHTSPGYCAGCGEICETKVEGDIPIGDILRYAMYCNGYGEKERASRLIKSLPPSVKEAVLTADFSLAEAYCPQRIQIGKLLHETYTLLS